MSWAASIYTVIVFGSAAVAIVVCFAALRNRPDPMAWPLAALMFAAAVWAVPHAISLGYTDLEHVVFWRRLLYLGAVFAPVAYLVVALKYAGHDQWLSRRIYAGLAVSPLLTIIAVWTNPVHGLFWESLSLAHVGGASVLVPEFGPLYKLALGYLYMLMIISLCVLAGVVVRSGPLYRKQATLMFLGGAAPLATNMVLNFGIAPAPSVDFTTTVLSISGLTFALALFHFDLLEIRPVARDLLIDELDDGVVVVGPDERIRDFNRTATQILGDIEVEQPAAEVLPSDIAFDGGELVAEIDGQERLFHSRATTLTDKRGRETGRIVYLNDVTEIVSREQRISVLNRILRHNIRNELTVVSGRLDLLEDRVAPSDREHVQTASESAQRVIEFASKARHVERTLQTTETTDSVPVKTIAERAVQEAKETHPEACIDHELRPGNHAKIPVQVVDEELFKLALAELVENAIIHTDQEIPEVTLDVEVADDQAHVHVVDTGPTIPETETAVLQSRTETNFNHGSGLGLWLVKWTVSLSGGSLSFNENEPRGNVITLTLPAGGE